jgi:type VI protein secretion system component Hcp
MPGAFLKLPDLAGSSKDKHHSGWIELERVRLNTSWGLHNEVREAVALGRHPEITIVVSDEGVIQQLWNAAATSRTFETATLDMVSSTGATLRFRMSDVLIVSASGSSSVQGRPAFIFQLAFSGLVKGSPHELETAEEIAEISASALHWLQSTLRVPFQP